MPIVNPPPDNYNIRAHYARLRRFKRLSARQQRVFMSIWLKPRRAYYNTLARDLGLTKQDLKQTLDDLTEQGFIEYHRTREYVTFDILEME